MLPSMNALKSWLLRDQLPLVAAIFVLAVVVIAQSAERSAIAVYALSFWHYLVYALAFFWREVSVERFKQDAILLKTISLATLAFVLWATVPNLGSLIVMAIGFALNAAATRALGADRTYYGFELATVPSERITSFPFSVISHPMLIGNMMAYGGPLLDGEFREAWWPLALIHVLLNAATLLTEMYGGKSRSAGVFWSVTGLMLGSILMLVCLPDAWPSVLAAVIAGLVFGLVIMRRYS